MNALNVSKKLVVAAVVGVPVFSLIAVAPLYLFVALSAGFIFLARLMRRTVLPLNQGYFLLVSFFFVLPALSTIWSLYPGATVYRAVWPLYCLIVFFLALYALRANLESQIERITFWVPSVSFIVFVVVFVLYGSLRPAGGGVGSISNLGGSLVVSCLPFAIASKRSILRKGLLIMVILTVVVLSEGRSSAALFLFAFPVTMFFLPGSAGQRMARFVFWATFLLAMTAALLVWFEVSFLGKLTERFRDTQIYSFEALQNPDPDAADYGRALMMAAGLRAFQESWPKGIGFGALPDFMLEYGPYQYVSHSFVITFTSELGILGTLALALLVIGTIQKMRSVPAGSMKGAISASLVLILLQAIFRPPYANGLLPVLLASVSLLATKQHLRDNGTTHAESQTTVLKQNLFHRFPSTKIGDGKWR